MKVSQMIRAKAAALRQAEEPYASGDDIVNDVAWNLLKDHEAALKTLVKKILADQTKQYQEVSKEMAPDIQKEGGDLLEQGKALEMVFNKIMKPWFPGFSVMFKKVGAPKVPTTP